MNIKIETCLNNFCSFIRYISIITSRNNYFGELQTILRYATIFETVTSIGYSNIPYASTVKWGLLTLNEVGLFQIFNHVKTIKNH